MIAEYFSFEMAKHACGIVDYFSLTWI